MKWNKQQNEALNLVYKWLRSSPSKRKPVFKLFGYAGTGKTTLAKEIEKFIYQENGKNNVPQGLVHFCAYTGQASHVLSLKGVSNTGTFHSLVYKPDIDSKGRLRGFIYYSDSPVSHAALLVIDEASFINSEHARDALRFGVPILVLMDPFQLPPVEGDSYFDGEPDYMLTDVERQRKESPIVEIATQIRSGIIPKPGRYGSSVINSSQHLVSDKMFMNADMIICGMKKTRDSLNIRARKLNGKYDISPVLPTKGDSLISLRNNPNRIILNGMSWLCGKTRLEPVTYPTTKYEAGGTGDLEVLKFKVRSMDTRDAEGDLIILDVQCSPHHFDPSLKQPDFKSLRGTDDFSFGYARTCHKAQGSQASKVLVYDESDVFRELGMRWLYTAVTRAVDKLALQY